MEKVKAIQFSYKILEILDNLKGKSDYYPIDNFYVNESLENSVKLDKK